MSFMNADLTTFTTKINEMIATSDNAYSGRYSYQRVSIKSSYTPQEIDNIINNGSIDEKRLLSRFYFDRGGIYRRIILQYATFLKYSGILIPNTYGEKVNKFKNPYYESLKYLDKMKIEQNCVEWTTRALVDGVFYGLILSKNKNDDFYVMSLPADYCRTRFKDTRGRDVIEFNLNYFRAFSDPEILTKVLKRFPKYITQQWHRFRTRDMSDNWIFLPSESTICLPFLDGIPLFINIIPAALNYDEAVEVEKERDLEEIRKIIVQKIPHLNTGELLFEPDEAEVMHKGSVGMMKGNKNVSILTTYADVDAIVSKTSSDAVSDNLEKTRLGIFFEGGVSKEIFSPTSNLTIGYSLKTELALMMTFAVKISNFITQLINDYFGKKNISFTYKILPITYQNETEYITDALKLANVGYSFLLPAIAMDLNQSQIIGIKDLENDFLKIGEKLIPISASQSEGEETPDGKGKVGAPEKAPEDKSPKTESNQKSIDKAGG